MRTKPVLLVLFAFLAAMALGACQRTVEPTPTPQATPAPGDEVLLFEIHAEDNRFTPDEFVVPVNQTVTFMMTSVDQYHTFTVRRDQGDADDLFNLQVPTGGTDAVTWTFDEVGDYYLYCLDHEAAGMVGIIRVVQE